MEVFCYVKRKLMTNQYVKYKDLDPLHSDPIMTNKHVKYNDFVIKCLQDNKRKRY
jgi:hypothetical protein